LVAKKGKTNPNTVKEKSKKEELAIEHNSPTKLREPGTLRLINWLL